MISMEHHMLYTGVILFSLGLAIVITKRNAIMVLLGLELMLNAANLNLVYFNRQQGSNMDGSMFALFVIIVAVCEAAVGLAIVLKTYQHFKTSNPDEVSTLKE